MSGRRLRAGLAVAMAVLLTAGAASATDRYLLPEADGQPLTLLLLGSDEGPPRGPDPLQGRADGFQLLFVSADRQHATFVSIPRDSWVNVAGRGNSRINSCLLGGGERCVETVEREFGIEVDGYFVTSMQAFKDAVQAFGGLTVDVRTPVYDGGASITSAGEQHLTGSQALTYGRDRKNRAGGDFARSQAQAELLATAHAEVVANADPDQVLRAAAALRRHTLTDLPGPRVARLAFEALRLPPENVQRVLAEGDNATIGGAAVVRLRSSAYAVIADAAEDARVG